VGTGAVLNTTYHMSIGMSPFMALYGYDAPTFAGLMLLETRVLAMGDLIEQSRQVLICDQL